MLLSTWEIVDEFMESFLRAAAIPRFLVTAKALYPVE